MNVLDYQHCFQHPVFVDDGELAAWREVIAAAVAEGFNESRYGDIPRWREALLSLPDLSGELSVVLDQPAVSVSPLSPVSPQQQLTVEQALRGLMPWRKGPFSVAGVSIDTEWRSDKKWARLVDAIEPLQDRLVLDVGCGSGYHCWRMRAEGTAFEMGIEPSPLFVMQYWALQRYIQDKSTWVLPMGIEQLPEATRAFDTVFSMGILYHRRSPIDHLLTLRETLREGGQLVLETLVVEGDDTTVLVPEGRYAKMGNVWFIPSVAMLERWLKKLRFSNVKLLDVSLTDASEQRSTDWMTFQSLPDFLDPNDASLTYEGYPAPRRAILTATAP
ncbi:tRNA 5-methoxyuridine(34)/uridine 5-oxyacetic acid(34) synthase CmoB [bacterium]|nr:tRNA 5-methoxyuridine(34)/uridine 5-oxyacetic acid(34) synthase CmoB [bacterium]